MARYIDTNILAKGETMEAEWTNSDVLTIGQTTQSNNFNALNALECVGTQTADVVDMKTGKVCFYKGCEKFNECPNFETYMRGGDDGERR